MVHGSISSMARLLLCIVLGLSSALASAFLQPPPPPAQTGTGRGERVVVYAAPQRQPPNRPTSEAGLGTKLAWYASEAFGDVASAFKGDKKSMQVEDKPPVAARVAAQDALRRLKTDYERVYFVTGNMDVDLYEQDCEFADPFVAFNGVQRFKKNLDNLGSFMEDVDLKLTKFEALPSAQAAEFGEGMVVQTRWRFRCVLGLPWRPTLAAAGGTVHVFSKDSGRIVRHIESWDIEPWDGVKQVLTPGRKRRPKTQ